MLVNWLAKKFLRLSYFLGSSKRHGVEQAKYVDLAPSDKADEAGIYREAINFAISNPKIKNIALTGPYGSGKSSILQAFLKKYKRPVLHISLAAFTPEVIATDGSISRQEIERSILQQMLYGVDANRLPLSRFKRIQSPGVLSIFKSFYILAGLLTLWIMFSRRDEITSGDFFTPLQLSNWFNLGISLIAILFLWTALHYFYIVSFGLSLKSVSLKDVEISPSSVDQESILNRHLDEIMYFFQSTEYDLVIIEDLDRFNDSEVFVTLREINGLINRNSGVKRTIRFLYALRDDMFINTDRTKFFEFIIPVIPIINTSNSIDMVLQQGRRLKLDERLDRQFLREVSRYLDDLRLIQNVFNEYAIYIQNLESDGDNFINANRLLAILIYKNVYPMDFERLHRGEGNLAGILGRQEEFIAECEAQTRAQIQDLEREIQIAEAQTPSNVKELRKIYAMALIERLPDNAIGVGLNWNEMISLNKIADHQTFDHLIEQRSINCRVYNSNITVDISSLQREIDPYRSFNDRKTQIEVGSSEVRTKILGQVHDLRLKLAKFRMVKLSELIQMNVSLSSGLFDAFGKKGQLARFLILEGYLDDTYYQYTSLFHSGRLSPNDNKFLIQIRAFINPEPTFPIDNPKEVIAAMRHDDFRQAYVLNVKIVDCILNDPINYSVQTQSLFDLIISDFYACEAFFEAYYATGRNVEQLITKLSMAWNDLVPTAISSSKSVSHINRLLVALSEDNLVQLGSRDSQLSTFVQTNIVNILALSPELKPERLACLNFEVKELAKISDYIGVVRFMFEKGLFQLSIENIEYACAVILGGVDLESLRKRNFTTVRATNNEVLLARLERNFGLYLHDVILGLPDNSEEDHEAILDVVRRDNLDEDDLRTFLERQLTPLRSLDDVPTRLHQTLFELARIEPTWANCLGYIKSESFEAESLIQYLDRDDIRTSILKQTIPDDSDSLPLRQFLINANSLSDLTYQAYLRVLPRPFSKFPEGLDPAKVTLLIDERKVTFSKDSFGGLSGATELQVHFVANNIRTYLASPENFALDDSALEKLLRSNIDQDAQREIVKLMDLSSLLDNPERSELIGNIFNSTDIGSFDVSGSIVQSVIKHSSPIATQVSLLNKFQSNLTEDEVRQILSSLPKPFSEIKTGYGIPRLSNSPENRDLVRWLEKRGIISSWREGGFFSNEIKVHLYRR